MAPGRALSTWTRVVPRPRLVVPEQRGVEAERTIIRAVRRVPVHSTEGVLIRVLREVRSPHWTAVDAGVALAAHVEGDLRRLRSARVHVVVASLDHRTVCDVRALATIDVAIAQIEGRPLS